VNIIADLMLTRELATWTRAHRPSVGRDQINFLAQQVAPTDIVSDYPRDLDFRATCSRYTTTGEVTDVIRAVYRPFKAV
jgi:hypothetical protein